jgi:hypothetical protein
MTIVDDALKVAARQWLLQRAQSIQDVVVGVTVEKTFTLAELRNRAADKGIRAWLKGDSWPYLANQSTLYVIRAVDVETATQLVEEFRTREAQDFAAARVNSGTEGSAVLYVGSSGKVRSRLREHLWRASSKTYAVHFERWCKVTDGTLTISVQPILNVDDPVVRQDLEDAVWRELRPRLGKLGGR